MKNLLLTDRQLKFFTAAFIVLISAFPLFFDLPFRDNLFLTWEGTYRLSIGQIPYRDFTMPIGYGLFIIPFIFFKIFGSGLVTLLYAQVFTNIVLLWVFGKILRLLNISEIAIFFATMVFAMSYTFVFFWPWYNHAALFYELVGIYFIVKLISLNKISTRNLLYCIQAGFFIFLSLFTKQDYGGLALIFSLVLLCIDAITQKRWKLLVGFIAFYALFAFIFIFPLLPYQFSYWFNHGQAPHSSRLSLFDLINEFFGGSSVEKLYLLMIFLYVFYRFSSVADFFKDRNHLFLFLITVGMIVQTLLTKVTSRLPADTTTYFHAFAIVYLIQQTGIFLKLRNVFKFFAVFGLFIIWWSAIYWDYANRIFKPAVSVKTEKTQTLPTISVNNSWKSSKFKTFKKITLPQQTIKGIDSIKILYSKIKSADPVVLNMSELTPLAAELNYKPIKNLPLWYHLNIGIFQSQVDTIAYNIQNSTYDMVLFEFVPNLDNFYPFSLRDSLKKHYSMPLVFPAPRKDGKSIIEVFVRKSID